MMNCGGEELAGFVALVAVVVWDPSRDQSVARVVQRHADCLGLF